MIKHFFLDKFQMQIFSSIFRFLLAGVASPAAHRVGIHHSVRADASDDEDSFVRPRDLQNARNGEREQRINRLSTGTCE